MSFVQWDITGNGKILNSFSYFHAVSVQLVGQTRLAFVHHLFVFPEHTVPLAEEFITLHAGIRLHRFLAYQFDLVGERIRGAQFHDHPGADGIFLEGLDHPGSTEIPGLPVGYLDHIEIIGDDLAEQFPRFQLRFGCLDFNVDVGDIGLFRSIPGIVFLHQEVVVLWGRGKIGFVAEFNDFG